MAIEIDTRNYDELTFSGTGHDRIIRNVINLIKTMRYEVPYDRTRGIDSSVLNMPYNQMLAIVTSQIIQVVSRYEPRARVIEVKNFSINEDGDCECEVVLDI